MATRKKKPTKRPAKRAAAPRPAQPAQQAQPERQAPETTRFRSVAPSFTVSDLKRSIAFYGEVLAFYPGKLWEDGGRLVGMEFKAGAVTFYISQDDFAKGRDRVKGVGHRLSCLTVQDVDALAARIKASGGRLDSEPQDTAWGTRAFSIADPDGFKFTIYNEKA